MQTKVVIENGSVHLVEEKIRKTMGLSEWAEKVSASYPISSGFLPSGCVYYQRVVAPSNYKYDLYMVERKPGIYKFKFADCILQRRTQLDNPLSRSYSIPMPYYYMVMLIGEAGSLDTHGTFMSPKQVRSFDDVAYTSYLPNTYDLTSTGGTGNLCIGGYDHISSKNNKNHEIADGFVNALDWSSFNDDLNTWVPLEVFNRMGSLCGYVKKSKTTPRFVMTYTTEWVDRRMKINQSVMFDALELIGKEQGSLAALKFTYSTNQQRTVKGLLDSLTYKG